jgi:hypothetical protein
MMQNDINLETNKGTDDPVKTYFPWGYVLAVVLGLLGTLFMVLLLIVDNL